MPIRKSHAATRFVEFHIVGNGLGPVIGFDKFALGVENQSGQAEF